MEIEWRKLRDENFASKHPLIMRIDYRCTMQNFKITHVGPNPFRGRKVKYNCAHCTPLYEFLKGPGACWYRWNPA